MDVFFLSEEINHVKIIQFNNTKYFTMKTILVPVDFSDNSKNAMDYAILLANKMNMKLLLMHSFYPTMAEAISDSYKALQHKNVNYTPKEMRGELNIWQKVVNDTEHNIPCETVFKEGDLLDTITELMKERTVDLIVMGTKGATGLKEIFMGSNTTSVIEKVSCPVIAVPEGYRFTQVKRIAFATNYNDSDITSIRFTAKMANAFGSELSIVHFADGKIPERYEGDQMDRFSEIIDKNVRYNKIKFHLLEGEDVIKSLEEYINDNKIDLLAVSTEDRILLGPLFNQGLTKKFACNIQIPLIAFHTVYLDDNDLF